MRTLLLSCFVASALALNGDFALPGGSRGMLMKYEPLEDYVCQIPGDEQRAALRALDQAAPGGPDASGAPVRTIRDEYPAFAAVAVDAKRNEVILTDENLFQILVFDRLENTPGGAERSLPKRTISGADTGIEFQSGVYVDEATGEIFATNNDTRDKTVVFPPNADGNRKPIRQIETPHGTFGVAVDNAHQEVILAVQHDSAIVAYRKQADGAESPIRVIQGSRTGLADPHGVALDLRDDLVFTANYGSTHDVNGDLVPRAGVPSAGKYQGKTLWTLGREYSVPGSGTISAPSIVVHRRSASGNVAPVRLIQGPATQLNWPTGLAFDAERRELFVANDMGPSVLVFDADASGNAAPKRVLKGRATGLANPTGVFADVVNHELWVTNFGGHSATVYDLAAQGDVAPKRTIRAAPVDAPSLMIGNPGAVAFDSKREQLLVPN